eukprot:Skav225071  [mRNA]  locus=scaffold4576:45540:50132:- [translate_table: standard]
MDLGPAIGRFADWAFGLRQEYAAQIANADQMLSVFAEFVPAEEGRHCHGGEVSNDEDPEVLVPEGTVEMWELLLKDEKGCADVKLEVSTADDGSQEGSSTLRAHSAVLRSASPVLNALLTAPMKEGATRVGVLDVWVLWWVVVGRSGHIRVDGVSLEAARLYTGCTGEVAPSMAELLGALDLAHRWQVPQIVSRAENELVQMVPWTQR